MEKGHGPSECQGDKHPVSFSHRPPMPRPPFTEESAIWWPLAQLR